QRGPPWLSDVLRHTSPATVPQYTCFFRNFKCFFALFLDKSCTYCRLLAADRPDRPSPCAAFLYMKKSVISSAPFPPGAGKEREPFGSRSETVEKSFQIFRQSLTAAPPPGSSRRGGSAGWRRKFSF